MIKKYIKKIVPACFMNEYQDILARKHYYVESQKDIKLYRKFANFKKVGDTETGIEELLIFHTHAIEKGLSHPHFRSRFGSRALDGLKLNLDEYIKHGYDKTQFAYQNALSILRAYKAKHQSLNIAIPDFDEKFAAFNLSNATDIAGVKKTVHASDIQGTFSEISQLRVSTRTFSSLKVDGRVLMDAVRFAIKTPSVCNRQPWHVYSTSNSELIQKILVLQGGFAGYPTPPQLNIITVDRTAFMGPYERNEPYVDGGLFLMNFVYALTAKGLDSCILNLMQPHVQLSIISNLMKIPDRYVLIAIVVDGYAVKDAKSPNSARKEPGNFLSFVE